MRTHSHRPIDECPFRPRCDRAFGRDLPGSVRALRSLLESQEAGLLILGAFATARGLSMLQPGRFRFSLGTPLIGGVILAILVGSRWSDLHEALDRATNAGLSASIGIGYWAVVAGTACVLLGGVLSLRRPA